MGELTRVLVVEDNLAAFMAVKGALKRLDCEVDGAETGEESITKVRDNSYDIIFMDMGLPDITGIEATKKIREFSQVPIVALTGYSDKKEDCLQAGMQDLVLKPSQPSDLKAMIKQYAGVMVEEKPASQEQPPIKKPETATAADGRPDARIIDTEGCVKMQGGDTEMTKQILETCAEELEESSDVIEKAYKNKDISALRSELHKVRGGVCYLKLPELEEALKTFHESVKAEPAGSEVVEKNYQHLREATRNFQGSISAATGFLDK